VGKGSRFTLVFPSADGEPVDLTERLGARWTAAPATDERGADEAVSDTADRPGILLVEDTADMRLFLRGFLERRYRVLEAANGLEALELCGARGEEIDLVMTDIMMPLMDGRELYKRICADGRSRHMPFLFLTARASPEEKVEAMGEGTVDYIYKPFSVEEVLAKTEAERTVAHHLESIYRKTGAGSRLELFNRVKKE
jgi:DNA-binding response OmpR family regulator